MARTLTQEERQMLLDNPQLVMFKAQDGLSPLNKTPMRLAFLPITVMIVVLTILVFAYRDFFATHETLTDAVLTVGMLLSVITVPVVFVVFENRRWKSEHSDHFRIPLARVMPEEIQAKVVTITHVDYMNQQDMQYALLTCTEDGIEKKYNYFAFVNRFELPVGHELLIVTGADGFFAFIRRSTDTERLYTTC